MLADETRGSRPELYDVAPKGASIVRCSLTKLGAHAPSFTMSPRRGLGENDRLEDSGLTPRALRCRPLGGLADGG